MGKIARLILVIILPLMIAACRADDETQLYFIGDSLADFWDLPYNFNSIVTTNLGKGGCHIEYIEEMAGRLSKQKIVVMVGTNDNQLMTSAHRESYVQRYVNAIIGLGGSTTYLFEIPPRFQKGDRPDINTDIQEFNNLVQQTIKQQPNIIYIPLYNDFFDTNGKIREDYYTDGLHLSAAGYELIAIKLRRYL